MAATCSVHEMSTQVSTLWVSECFTHPPCICIPTSVHVESECGCFSKTHPQVTPGCTEHVAVIPWPVAPLNASLIDLSYDVYIWLTHKVYIKSNFVLKIRTELTP